MYVPYVVDNLGHSFEFLGLDSALSNATVPTEPLNAERNDQQGPAGSEAISPTRVESGILEYILRCRLHY
jgi:hypothetical protein